MLQYQIPCTHNRLRNVRKRFRCKAIHSRTDEKDDIAGLSSRGTQPIDDGSGQTALVAVFRRRANTGPLLIDQLRTEMACIA